MQKKQNVGTRDMRVASAVQKHVAEILQNKFSDDKLLSLVSIAGSSAKGGLQYVRIYYHLSKGAGDRAAVQKRLDEVASTIRYELAGRMNQKQVPELRFFYDDTLERGKRIEELLASIKDDMGK